MVEESKNKKQFPLKPRPLKDVMEDIEEWNTREGAEEFGLKVHDYELQQFIGEPAVLYLGFDTETGKESKWRDFVKDVNKIDEALTQKYKTSNVYVCNNKVYLRGKKETKAQMVERLEKRLRNCKVNLDSRLKHIQELHLKYFGE